MAIQVVTTRNSLVTTYTGLALYGALSSTAPTSSPGTEITGGSPAYARKSLAWGAAASSASTATAVTFDVPNGATVAGFMLYSASTAGTYIDGVALTSQAFSSQGTYTVTPTYTQS